MTQHSSDGTQSRRDGAATVDWEAALAKHDRWLRTVVFARLRDWSEVDEVMQEVALAAVRQSAPLADASKVAPWLYRLAIRQSLLFRRSSGRRRKLIGRYADRHRPTEDDQRTPDPLSWLLADERRQVVRSAIAQLPMRDAEILMLKYSENWSYHKIAEHLGISHSAVEARLHRARQRMRTALEGVSASEVTV